MIFNIWIRVFVIFSVAPGWPHPLLKIVMVINLLSFLTKHTVLMVVDLLSWRQLMLLTGSESNFLTYIRSIPDPMTLLPSSFILVLSVCSFRKTKSTFSRVAGNFDSRKKKKKKEKKDKTEWQPETEALNNEVLYKFSLKCPCTAYWPEAI